MEAQRIIIKTEGEYNRSASGSEIWIVGALVDDIWYSAEEIFDHTWLKKWRMIGWNSYTQGISNEVWGFLKPGERYTYLVFEKNRWRGKCRIEFLGKQAEIDCYGDADGGLSYVEL